MPNRIIRENMLTSKRVCMLGWAEEVFYRRLQQVVDDFGRHENDVELLRAKLYSRQLAKVSEPDIAKWMQTLAEAGLVRLYGSPTEPERYLEVLRFNQLQRAKKSKYPDPPPLPPDPGECAADAVQVTSTRNADARLDVVVVEGVAKHAGGRATPVDKSRPKASVGAAWAGSGSDARARPGESLEEFRGRIARDNGDV